MGGWGYFVPGDSAIVSNAAGATAIGVMLVAEGAARLLSTHKVVYNKDVYVDQKIINSATKFSQIYNNMRIHIYGGHLWNKMDKDMHIGSYTNTVLIHDIGDDGKSVFHFYFPYDYIKPHASSNATHYYAGCMKFPRRLEMDMVHIPLNRFKCICTQSHMVHNHPAFDKLEQSFIFKTIKAVSLNGLTVNIKQVNKNIDTHKSCEVWYKNHHIGWLEDDLVWEIRHILGINDYNRHIVETRLDKTNNGKYKIWLYPDFSSSDTHFYREDYVVRF